MVFRPILKSRASRLGGHIIDATDNCSSLLDLGCGDMVLGEFINRKTGKSVTGVDTLDYNGTDLPILIYDGKTLPFENKQFDASLAAFVLHHCQDIDALLGEMKRVTRKKIIIIEEVYRNRFSRFVLNAHDTIGNYLISSSIDVPLNFKTMGAWSEIFSGHGLVVEGVSRIRQYPLLNLTHQVLFELSLQ